MTTNAELHLLKQRIAELEETVETIDRGLSKKELKLRDQFAIALVQGLMARKGRLYASDIAELYGWVDSILEARDAKFC